MRPRVNAPAQGCGLINARSEYVTRHIDRHPLEIQ